MSDDVIKRVLVVDDDPQTVNMMKLLLTKADYEVLCAHSGKDALEIIDREDVLVVVTDISMPNMNGITLLREIKHLRGMVQVIMATASDDLELLLQAMEGGADDFLLKPLDLERISEAVGAAHERITRWRNVMRELFERREAA